MEADNDASDQQQPTPEEIAQTCDMMLQALVFAQGGEARIPHDTFVATPVDPTMAVMFTLDQATNEVVYKLRSKLASRKVTEPVDAH